MKNILTQLFQCILISVEQSPHDIEIKCTGLQVVTC